MAGPPATHIGVRRGPGMPGRPSALACADLKGEAKMKVRNSMRSLKSKPGSVVVRRHGVTRVINKKNPRWNGRQG
jgi:large subunit ribosomal protein L36